jgi:hypothetical protein
MTLSSDPDKRKLLSALSHGSIFISTLILSIGIPIGVLLTTEDSVVKENAKEAINFHINVWAYGIVLGILSFVTFGLAGWVLGPIYLLFHWGLAAWAVYACLSNENQPFRYPFIVRVL